MFKNYFKMIENLGYKLSLLFGIFSNIIWFFVFIPQFLNNIRNKNVDALSYYMILFILLGNILSYISAKGKDVSYIIIYGSLYHIILGTIVLLQWMYYKIKNNDMFYTEENYLYLGRDNINNIYFIKKFIKRRKVYITILLFIVLLIIKISSNILKNELYYNIIGWISIALFINSRIPQILLNYRRRTTEGLSKVSFILISLANCLFFTSLMIRIIDIDNKNEYLYQNMQWLIGCVTTILFDLIILVQYYKYDYAPSNIIINNF